MEAEGRGRPPKPSSSLETSETAYCVLPSNGYHSARGVQTAGENPPLGLLRFEADRVADRDLAAVEDRAPRAAAPVRFEGLA